MGFPSGWIPVTYASRKTGASSYTFRNLVDLAFNNMIAFSEKPLWLTVRIGFSLSLLSELVGLTYISMFLSGYIMVSGFTRFIISLWFLSEQSFLYFGGHRSVYR